MITTHEDPDKIVKYKNKCFIVNIVFFFNCQLLWEHHKFLVSLNSRNTWTFKFHVLILQLFTIDYLIHVACIVLDPRNEVKNVNNYEIPTFFSNFPEASLSISRPVSCQHDCHNNYFNCQWNYWGLTRPFLLPFTFNFQNETIY